MAELVDALASGASARMGVEVRVFSWAPFLSEHIKKAGESRPLNLPFILQREGRLTRWQGGDVDRGVYRIGISQRRRPEPGLVGDG